LKTSARRLCKILNVSESGYYEWCGRGPSKRTLADEALAEQLEANHAKHRERYGSRRHAAQFQRQGCPVGRNRVRRIMRESNLVSRRTKLFRVTTKSDHDHAVAPNLLDRNFHPTAPNAAWVCDITFIRTTDGWLYLAVILDLFSRRVVGWSMGERITKRLAISALDMAIKRREVRPGLLVHSDRGSQYASADHRKALRAAKLECSMSRKANCWDNAVAESFFATLETELLDILKGKWTRNEARAEVFRFLETYYNRDRLHSTLGYRTPVEYEEAYAAKVLKERKVG
jgi:putative transposase